MQGVWKKKVGLSSPVYLKIPRFRNRLFILPINFTLCLPNTLKFEIIPQRLLNEIESETLCLFSFHVMFMQ